jgi:ATP-dependent DNA helicase RecQ
MAVLRGETRVMLRQETTRRVRNPERPSRPRTAPATTLRESDASTLFDALRAWRAAEAKAQSVPPYVIFHDTVLRELAAVRPASLDELGQVKGVGASKLKRYGVAVLEVVARYRQ